jgi:hypothetical protein
MTQSDRMIDLPPTPRGRVNQSHLQALGNVPIDLEPFMAAEDAKAGERVDGGSFGGDTEPGRLYAVWIPHNGLVELEVADQNGLVQSRLYLTHAHATHLSALLLKGR